MFETIYRYPRKITEAEFWLMLHPVMTRCIEAFLHPSKCWFIDIKFYIPFPFMYIKSLSSIFVYKDLIRGLK